MVFAKLNLCKTKIFSCCFFNSHKSNIAKDLVFSGKPFDIRCLLTKSREFNTEMSETAMCNFFELYHLYDFIEKLYHYKKSNKLLCNKLFKNINKYINYWFIKDSYSCCLLLWNVLWRLESTSDEKVKIIFQRNISYKFSLW